MLWRTEKGCSGVYRWGDGKMPTTELETECPLDCLLDGNTGLLAKINHFVITTVQTIMILYRRWWFKTHPAWSPK